MWWEQVVHDDEVYLAVLDLVLERDGHLDSVEAVELAEQRVWVLFHVVVIFAEVFAEMYVFCAVYRFDDELVVSGVVEERPALPRRVELAEDVL